MKKIMLIFLIFCTQLSLSMDQINAPSQQTIINQISADISIKHARLHPDLPSDFINNFTQVRLNSGECLDIIRIVEKHCASNTAINLPDILNGLYQNFFFHDAITYFVARASDNLQLLTADTITTIENPQKKQPTRELNDLSLPIKTYVMNHALELLKHPYYIILSGQHTDNIQAFDICEQTDQVVTSSFQEKPTLIENFLSNNTYNWNNVLCVWNLKTGKVIKKINESSPINLVAFNPDGSCIAGALYNKNDVKVWCPNTGNLLHTFSSMHKIDTLSYSHNGHLLTAIHRDRANYPVITQWVLTSCKVGDTINHSIVPPHHKLSPFEGIKYKAYVPTPLIDRKNELKVTKRNCIPLWICLKAISATGFGFTPIKQNEIEKSNSYCQLTDLEKEKVEMAIQQKPGFIRLGESIKVHPLFPANTLFPTNNK